MYCSARLYCSHATAREETCIAVDLVRCTFLGVEGAAFDLPAHICISVPRLAPRPPAIHT